MIGCGLVLIPWVLRFKFENEIAFSIPRVKILDSTRNMTTKTKTAAVQQTVNQFLTFVNASPSPFHAVHESVLKLEAAGFTSLSESDAWDTLPGGKYFVTRNQSAIVAFAVGQQYQVGRDGFSIIGAHTDSPCLKVKPISAMTSQGYLQVGVECYGGGLWHTWFDRDLGLAGRVIVENETQSGFESKLVLMNKPLLHIPTLAIHLDREVSTKGFSFNKEKQLRPILATKIQAELNAAPAADAASASSTCVCVSYYSQIPHTPIHTDL